MGVSALGSYEDPDEDKRETKETETNTINSLREDPDEDKRETPRLLVLSAQGETTYVRYFPHMFFR